MGIFGFFDKKKKQNLDEGLAKTKESVFAKLGRAVIGKSKVDDEVLDNLEEILISSDVGVETTLKIIKRIEARVLRDKYLGVDELNKILVEAHQVPFGDVLLEYLILMKDALLNHVHNGSGNPATDLTVSGNKQTVALFKSKANDLEKSMLSKNVRIN